MGTKPNLNANLSFPIFFAPIFHFPVPRARSRSPFPVLVTSVKFYLVFLVVIGGYCLQNAKLLQSEELEKGNCQSLVNGTSGPYYAIKCPVPYYDYDYYLNYDYYYHYHYYYRYYKRDSETRSCLWNWCSLIALCFNETSDWKTLCYNKFYCFGWSNFDISTATKDVNVLNVRNIYIKNCGWKTSLLRFKIKATEYRCESKTAQTGTYAEIKHYMCYEVIRVS